MQPKPTSNNIKEHKVMIPPNPSTQVPTHLEAGWAEYATVFPLLVFSKGCGKLPLLLCELFSDTAASELTVRDVLGHHNPRNRRRK